MVDGLLKVRTQGDDPNQIGTPRLLDAASGGDHGISNANVAHLFGLAQCKLDSVVVRTLAVVKYR